jgi:hypothetical protein
MNRILTGMFAAALFLSPALVRPAFAENAVTEAAEHPRIAAAIRELEEAIKYLEAAPHNFGGHKAAAIAASKTAVRDLTQALKFRAAQDNKKGKQ